MIELKYTLITDGTSDRALIPLINWVLRNSTHDVPIQANWADLSRVPQKSKSLAERIEWAIKLYQCNLLFIHRDAEGEGYTRRKKEILAAVEELGARSVDLPEYVCIIPVRMQEAWLLFDENAIRAAAGNPNGRNRLKLPLVKRVESLPDPKRVLYESLEIASGLTGRRLKRLNVPKSVHRVAELIESFEPLRVVKAFQAFEEDVRVAVRRIS